MMIVFHRFQYSPLALTPRCSRAPACARRQAGAGAWIEGAKQKTQNCRRFSECVTCYASDVNKLNQMMNYVNKLKTDVGAHMFMQAV